MSGDEFARRFAVVAETRRRWSQEEKQAVVEEASGSCVNGTLDHTRGELQVLLLHTSRWTNSVGEDQPTYQKWWAVRKVLARQKSRTMTKLAGR